MIDPGRVKDLFHGARDLPEPDRSDYLSRECAEEAPLRQRVEALLAADAVAGRFLAVPTAGDPAAIDADSEFIRLQRALAGRYSIERELGRGGMGVVYLARDIALGRLVAVKALPRELATSEEHRARFLREVRMAAGLSHPNVVPIHLVEEQSDVVCFVMSYVEGETLREWVQRSGPLSANEATRVMQEVAWALAHAHERGIVHRDVKPDNILIERGSQRALVTDFGIARTLDAAVTGEGFFLGTPLFASPEQAAGLQADGRSDLYSLGATTFFALTGRPPFDAPTAQAALERHISEPAPSVGALRQDLPRILVEVIDRSLAKDPAYRFGSAGELAKTLAATGSHEVPEAIRRVVRETRQLTVDVVSWGLFALMGGFGWVLWRLTSPDYYIELVTYVVMVLAGVGTTVIAVRTHEVLGEVREALRKGFRLTHIRSAVRAESAASDGRGALNPRRAVSAGVIAGLTVASWVTVYGPFSAPRPWLQLPVESISILGPLVLGRLITRGALSHAIPGFGWLRRVNRWLAGCVVRLAARGRSSGPTRGTIASHGEVAWATSATVALAGLPAAFRENLTGVPALVSRLERHANTLRARRDALERLLGAAGSAAAGVDPVVPDEGVTSKLRARSEASRAALVTAHEHAGARLRDVVAALEIVRLAVLRLHAGMAIPADLTEDLALAIEVDARIDALLRAGAEVDLIVGDGSGSSSPAYPEGRSRPSRTRAFVPAMVALFVADAAFLGMRPTKTELPVTIDTLWTTFDTRGRFVGSVVPGRDSLVVDFDSAWIEQHPFDEGRSSKHLDSMTISVVAGPLEDWVTVRTSAAAAVTDSLADRTRFALGRIRFAIPRPPLDTLRAGRLRILFYESDPAPAAGDGTSRVSTSYANSELFVLSAVR